MTRDVQILRVVFKTPAFMWHCCKLTPTQGKLLSELPTAKPGGAPAWNIPIFQASCGPWWLLWLLLFKYYRHLHYFKQANSGHTLNKTCGSAAASIVVGWSGQTPDPFHHTLSLHFAVAELHDCPEILCWHLSAEGSNLNDFRGMQGRIAVQRSLQTPM